MKFRKYRGIIPTVEKSGVYAIYSSIDRKFYIGSSLNMYNRMSGHFAGLMKGTHDNEYLQRAWNKYGSKNFHFVVVEECEPNQDKLIELENYYIDHFESYDRAKGYNMSRIANAPMAGRTHTEETKSKFRDVRQGWNTSKATQAAARVTFGQSRPVNVRAAISAGIKGQRRSLETRLNVKSNHWSRRSDAAEIAEKSASKNRGKKHSEERKMKIREAGLRRWAKIKAARILHATTS